MDSENSDLSDFVRNLGIPDSNMFVTSFVIYSFLESEELGIYTKDYNIIKNKVSMMFLNINTYI